LGSPRTPGAGHARGGRTKSERAVTLDAHQSAALREKLLTELANITSADLALTAKNSLSATDAKLVEDTFERRLSELPSSDGAAPSNDDSAVPSDCRVPDDCPTESIDSGQAKGIDKSILTVAAPRRYRNREHLRYVAQQAILRSV